MRIKSNLIIFYVLILAALSGNSQNILNLADFGIQPDTRQSVTAAVQNILNAIPSGQTTTLIFQKGRYDFWPLPGHEREYFESNTTDNNPKRLAMVLKGKKNIIIEGRGADFVFHDRIQPFTIDSSTNITLRNFTIDWDIPLTAQAQVVMVTDTSIDLKINTLESPYELVNGKLVFVGEEWKSEWWGVMEFDSDSRLIPTQTGDYPCLGEGWGNYIANEISAGVVRLKYAFKRKPKQGNYLVLRHSERDHAGIFICNSNKVLLQKISIYHTAGLGVLAQFSANLSYSNVEVVPNPLKNRILSGHDDGFHFSNCKGQITVDKCSFEGLMDDPINVHGTCVRVDSILSAKQLKCRFMHEQSVGMLWGVKGDTVGFIENTHMQTLGFGTIHSLKKLNNEVFIVDFESNLPSEIKVGYALENLSFTPKVRITNSLFKSCRARGILVSTPKKVLIQNNEFHSSGSAILIAGDANYWYESGAVTDVSILNNMFMDACMSSMYQFSEAIISIYPEIPTQLPDNYFHKNIKVIGNEFNAFDYPVLYAKSVDGLTFAENTIIRSYIYKPFHYRKFGIDLDGCSDVQIYGNKAVGDVLGRKVNTRNMKPNAVRFGEDGIFN